MHASIISFGWIHKRFGFGWIQIPKLFRVFRWYKFATFAFAASKDYKGFVCCHEMLIKVALYIASTKGANGKIPLCCKKRDCLLKCTLWCYHTLQLHLTLSHPVCSTCADHGTLKTVITYLMFTNVVWIRFPMFDFELFSARESPATAVRHRNHSESLKKDPRELKSFRNEASYDSKASLQSKAVACWHEMLL